jgi:putative iron-dependent peroxidase
VDDNLDAGLAIHRAMAGVATLGLDEKGFKYHDSRDLTGFIDGTANPKEEAARAAALVSDDAPGAGGSFVLTQRWVHDLDAFESLPVADQERVIGRTKPDSIELEGDDMPPDSHVSRTDVSSAKIYRRSAPFGSVAEKGLYFLAFACDIDRFDLLLRRMYGVTDGSIRDRLTVYSRPVTGSYWFAPSEEALSSLLKRG